MNILDMEQSSITENSRYMYMYIPGNPRNERDIQDMGPGYIAGSYMYIVHVYPVIYGHQGHICKNWLFLGHPGMSQVSQVNMGHGQGHVAGSQLGYISMFVVIPGTLYTWDIWDIGQGRASGSLLGHPGMFQVIPVTHGTRDIWDIGQGHVAGSQLGHPRMSQVIPGTLGTRPCIWLLAGTSWDVPGYPK